MSGGVRGVQTAARVLFISIKFLANPRKMLGILQPNKEEKVSFHTKKKIKIPATQKQTPNTLIVNHRFPIKSPHKIQKCSQTRQYRTRRVTTVKTLNQQRILTTARTPERCQFFSRVED